MSAARLFTDEHAELLLALLRLDTVSPLESDAPGRLPEAQQAYAAFAARRTGRRSCCSLRLRPRRCGGTACR